MASAKKSYRQRTPDWVLFRVLCWKCLQNIVKLVKNLGAAESEHVELGKTEIELLGHVNKMLNTKQGICTNLICAVNTTIWHLPLCLTRTCYTAMIQMLAIMLGKLIINEINCTGKAVNHGGGGQMRAQGWDRRGYNPYTIRSHGFKGRRRSYFPPHTEISAKSSKPV